MISVSRSPLWILLLTGSFLYLNFSPLKASSGQETVWAENFEGELPQVKPYHKDAPLEEFEIVEGDAVGGNHFFRSVLPGSRPLEGVSFIIENIPGNRLASVTAKVRGSGAISMMLRSGNGWLYAKHPTDLNHEWQELQLNKTLRGRETDTLVIYFLTQPTSKVLTNAVIEIDDIKVTIAPPLALPSEQVPPKWLSAANFAAEPEMIVPDGNKALLEDDTRVEMTGVPFPQTSQLITVYAHVRTSGEATLVLATTRGGDDNGNQQRQTIRDVRVSPSDDWQWIALEKVSAEETGEAVKVILSGTQGVVALGGIVVSTDPTVDGSSLDALVK